MSVNQVAAGQTNRTDSVYSQISAPEVDASTARKKWLNQQIQNFLNPQNTLPPSYDNFAPNGGDGYTAFNG